jgi:nucleoside-diphosphate-sugar epimerase
VTGGAGFIGSHLVDGLLEAGARVRVMDNLATGRKENLAHCLDRIEFVEVDIRDFEACGRAAAGTEIVFHQAALGSVPRSMVHPELSLDVNVRGTLNIFTACRDAGVKRVVYASSSSVYGDSEKLPKVEGEEGTPLSPYAWSKRANEEMAAVFHRCYGMDLIGLRYFNVFGPRQDPEGAYAAVIPRFFKAVLTGRAPVIYGDGEQSRDFTFVGDVVAANLAAGGAEGPAWNRPYNIAGGRRVSILDLARAVVAETGRPVEPEFGPPRPGDVKHSLADITAARHQLGFTPVVSFGEGLARSADYYRGIVD